MNNRRWERLIFCVLDLWLVTVVGARIAFPQIIQPQQGGTGTVPGNTLPSTPCGAGKIFVKLNAATSASSLYTCIASAWGLAGGGGGGGGTGDAGALVTTTFSATPTFTCPSSSTGTIVSFSLSTALSANVTSSTLATCTSGSVLNFTFTQASSGGPYTVAMPTGFTQACQVSPIASAITNMSFLWDGSTARALSCVSPSGSVEPVVAAPTTPPVGYAIPYIDSTSLNMAVKNSNGVVNHGVRTKAVVGGNCITGIADDGTTSTAACSGGGGASALLYHSVFVNNATAFTDGWSFVGGATAPNPLNLGASPWNGGVAGFVATAAAINIASNQFMIPANVNCAGTFAARVAWYPGSGAAVSEVMKWYVLTSFVADGTDSSVSPTFNTADTGTSTLGATPVAKQVTTSITMTNGATGCAAGTVMRLQLKRDKNDAADTMAGVAQAYTFELSVPVM